MDEHPNAAMFREAMEFMAAGEAERLADFVADDIVYHQIGLPPIEGKAALVEAMKEYEGVDFSVEVHDVVANDDHTVGLLEATVKVGDEEFKYRTAEIMHIEDGKITERWAFAEDTQAINDFFGKLAAG